MHIYIRTYMHICIHIDLTHNEVLSMQNTAIDLLLAAIAIYWKVLKTHLHVHMYALSC